MGKHQMSHKNCAARSGVDGRKCTQPRAAAEESEITHGDPDSSTDFQKPVARESETEDSIAAASPRKIYEEILSEPVPERLKKLIEELRRIEGIKAGG